MKWLRLFVMALVLGLLPGISQAASTEISLGGDHGKLAATLQTPDGKTEYPLILLLHGFTANRQYPLITSLANKLEKRGIASLRIDFNGHGESEGRQQDMTVPNELVDAEKALAYTEKLPGVTSVAIAGHSQGGVVASMLAGEKGTSEIKAMVLLAPAAVLRENCAQGFMFGQYFDPENPPESLTVGAGFKVGRNYLVSGATLPIFEVAGRYDGPACIIQGKSDQVVPYTYSLKYARLYLNSELHLLAGIDHGFKKGTDEAAEIAADYLDKRLH